MEKPNRPYELQKYDPAWKQVYADTAAKLRPLLGDNLVEVDHVGSTSIVGMVAKPQVDVLAVVKNLDAVASLHDTMARAGFKVHGRSFVNEDDEYFTLDSPDGRRLVSVHTLQSDNPRIADYKSFRDYLQSHEADRNLYISIKRSLNAEFPENIKEYYHGKIDTIHEIQSRATAWAAANETKTS